MASETPSFCIGTVSASMKLTPPFHCDIIFFVVLGPNADHGLFIHEVSRSHTTTHHSR